MREAGGCLTQLVREKPSAARRPSDRARRVFDVASDLEDGAREAMLAVRADAEGKYIAALRRLPDGPPARSRH